MNDEVEQQQPEHAHASGRDHPMGDMGSMVSRTVRDLMDLILATPDGGYLGSEPDLLHRFSVSRPTLRQAAKILESDQFLSVRRGVSGGFYGRRPESRHVVGLPTLWLKLQGASLADMRVANSLLMPEMAAQAARCQDAALVRELRAFREMIEGQAEVCAHNRHAIEREVTLSRLIARMCGNPVLLLYNDIGMAFGMLDRSFRFLKEPGRAEEWLSLERRFCDAMLDGDADVARLLAQRRSSIVEGWLTQDAQKRPTDRMAGALR